MLDARFAQKKNTKKFSRSAQEFTQATLRFLQQTTSCFDTNPKPARPAGFQRPSPRRPNTATPPALEEQLMLSVSHSTEKEPAPKQNPKSELEPLSILRTIKLIVLIAINQRSQNSQKIDFIFLSYILIFENQKAFSGIFTSLQDIAATTAPARTASPPNGMDF